MIKKLKDLKRKEKNQKVLGKLSNQGFVSKAPEKVVEEEREKQKKYEDMLDKVVERLESLTKNKQGDKNELSRGFGLH